MADVVLNNDVNVTVQAVVKIDNVVAGGAPSQMTVSENASFSGANWQAYNTSLNYTLSSGKGLKTIYFKVKDTQNAESNTVEKSIYYLPENDANVPTAGITIYPNPVNSSTTIKIYGVESQSTTRNKITIMTLEGAVVKQFEAEGNEFSHDFSNYREKILLIMVENQGNKFWERIINTK